MSALLEVKDLHVHAGGKPIVDGVDLALEPGEALGLAGESGCGKTTTALALMKLLPAALEQSGEMTLRRGRAPSRSTSTGGPRPGCATSAGATSRSSSRAR